MISTLMLAAAASLSCRVELAHYTLRTAPDVTAVFRDVESGRDWPSRLAYVIHMGKTGRTYWFLPWSGGTDDLQHLASTKDIDAAGWAPPSPDGGPRPQGDIDYLATDRAYNVIDAPPSRGQTAPAHILLATLGDRLWHQRTTLGPRDGAAKQFFDLTSCSASR
jgi:hypothetical protein